MLEYGGKFPLGKERALLLVSAQTKRAEKQVYPDEILVEIPSYLGERFEHVGDNGHARKERHQKMLLVTVCRYRHWLLRVGQPVVELPFYNLRSPQERKIMGEPFLEL